MDFKRNWLQIANTALARINVPMLDSLDQGDATAMLCNQLIPVAAGEVLSVRPWRCARKRTVLPALADPPAFGYTHAFVLPADFIQVVSVMDLDNEEWAIEGDRILADTDALSMIYTAFPAEARGLSPYIVSAIAARLAAKLSITLTSDTGMYQSLMNESLSTIQLAMMDEQAGLVDVTIETNSWRA